VFETWVAYCNSYMSFIPLSFILGFYVSFVASRWWQQYMAIPWPDKIIHAIALHVTGIDEESRMMRRTLARYINLSLVLILRSISSPLKKRFPTLDHLVEAGFITSTELGIYKEVPNKEFNTYWVPCTWFTALLRDIKNQKKIPDTMGVKHIMEGHQQYHVTETRQKKIRPPQQPSPPPATLPTISPAAPHTSTQRYPQVVTIATYSFFLAAIIGRQFEGPPSQSSGVIFPFFTILQFFVYMGLLKVAEQLINPFGDDDEDFELNWIIDRHMKVSYLIVDTLLLRTPPLDKDIFYDDESPNLPYTEASAEFKKKTYRGSVANMVIPEDKQNLILPDIQEETEEEGHLPASAPSSLPPTPRNSLNNLGGKESRSPGEEGAGGGGGGRAPSPSPRVVRRGSGGASQLSRSTSKRLATAGSKGISVALLAVGAHQGFLGADPEKVSLASGGRSSPTLASYSSQYSEDDSSRFAIQGESVILDIGNIDDEEKLKVKSSSSFRLPASIKARLAMRKKPVITWRPYIRNVTPSLEFQEPPFPEEIVSQFPEDLKVNLPKDMTVPGRFEEECAFMWRTIEDDSDSPNTPISGISEDLGDYAPSTSSYHPLGTSMSQPIPISKNSSPYTLQPGRALSYYQQTSLPASLSLQSKPPQVLVEDYGVTLDPRIHPRPAPRRSGFRRARYKTKSRMRCLACSMPLLPCHKKSSSSTPDVPSLVRSLSDSSVFLDAVVQRLGVQQQQQQQVAKTQQPQSTSRPSPQLKRQQLSLPLSSATKPAVNGRRGWRNSPSPETHILVSKKHPRHIHFFMVSSMHPRHLHTFMVSSEHPCHLHTFMVSSEHPCHLHTFMVSSMHPRHLHTFMVSSEHPRQSSPPLLHVIK
ncbi:hypothetical protein Pcinc_017634, partial [Petrolisthes cinctipes]